MKNLQKPAEFGKAALTIASMLIMPGPLAAGMGIIGETAGFLINCVKWDKEGDNRIAMAVQNALRQVKSDVPQGARKIVDELLASLDSPFDINQRIKQTDSYMLQSETPQTRRVIAEKFQLRFRMEMRKYPDLHLLVGTLDGLISVLDSIEQRMQKHDSALDTHEQMIEALKAEMERIAKEPILCLPGMTPGVKLIGRENYLVEFTREAATKGKICVVSGIGGVGKTEFIKTYLQEHMDTLGCVGWFEYHGTFRDTLLAVPGLVLHSCAPVDDPKARYNEIMGLLRQLMTVDLLVFDNVGRVESAEDMDAILSLPCKVIFTTRDAFDEDRNRLLVYDMSFLSPEACAALFAHYRGEETPEAEQVNLREVIRLAGEHTLALELMAKTCKSAGLSVGELLERLNKDGFNLNGLREEVRREGGRENKRFLEHMLKLYDIADIKAMGEEAEWLLANLSILPLHDFDIKVLVRWLDLPDRLLLNKLNDRGWIRIGNGDTVTMHAVIAEVVRAALKPDSERCEKLMDAVSESIHYSETDVEIYQAPYLYCAESVLKHVVADGVESLAKLCLQVGNIQYIKGDYSRAQPNFVRAMTISEKVLGRKHADTASSYNSLASLYHTLGDYENALKYYMQAMAIREKVLGRKHPDTASSYNNLAALYKNLSDYTSALKYYIQAMAIYEKVLGREHPATASSYNNLASLYSDQGDYKNALKYSLLALDIREKVLGKKHPDTAFSYSSLANLYGNQGDYENAMKYYMQAMDIYEKVLGRDHPNTALAYNNLAILYDDQGDYENAMKYYLQAMAIVENVFGREHPDTASSYNNLAGLYEELGDYKSALKYNMQAMDIHEKVLGKMHPDTATIYNNLASLYSDQGDYKNALKYFLQAMDIREKVLGKKHPDTASTYNNLALLYEDQGDYENALKYHLQAMAIREKVLGKEHPATASSYNNIAILYDGQGDYENALKYHLQAMAIRENVLGKEHLDTATTYNNLASLYRYQGDYENALKLYIKAMAIREKVLGKEHLDTANTYYNLANLYSYHGDYENALNYYMKAIDTREKVLGKEHPDTAGCYNNLANLYDDQGDYENALEYHLQAMAIREKVLGREHPVTATTYNNMAILFLKMEDKENAAQNAEAAYKVFLAKLGENHEDTRRAKKLLDNMRKK